MTKWIFIATTLALIAGVSQWLKVYAGRAKRVYHYERHDHLMTRAERECFQALVAELGHDYHFFPQIHLDSLIAPQETGPSRRFAFRHINQESLDFVACDKKLFHPLFAIELDDRSHNLPRRSGRDHEVARILNGAGLPLIRIRNQGHFDPKALAQEVQKSIERCCNLPQARSVS